MNHQTVCTYPLWWTVWLHACILLLCSLTLCMLRSHCSRCTTLSVVYCCIIHRNVFFILVGCGFIKSIKCLHLYCFYLFHHFPHIHDLCITGVFHCRNAERKWSVRIRNASVPRTMSSRQLLLASWACNERVAATHFLLPFEAGNNALMIYWTAIYENKNIKPTREICWKHLANLSITALFSSCSILCIKWGHYGAKCR